MKISSFFAILTTTVLLLAKPVLGVGDCGCSSSCSSSMLDQDAGGYSARARIDWVIGNMGKSESDACQMVCGDEYPNVCKKCAPRSGQCRKGNNNNNNNNNNGGGSRCGCSSCTSSVLNRSADGYKVKDRIDWLKGNRSMSEQAACSTVCGSEYSNICGQCNPGQCSGGNTGNNGNNNGGGGALSVVTQNLWWHVEFDQRGGRNFFKEFKSQGLLDIYMFQECRDVNRIKNGLGFGSMQVKQFSHDLAIAWNGSRFRKLNDGMAWVGADQVTQSWNPNRYVAWVRLQDRSTSKVILAVSHHGPLSIDTGGKFGMNSVASKIDGAINNARRSGDVVVLAGDFNVHAGRRTLQVLQGRGYKKHASEWVDHILTKSGLTSTPQTTIIRGGGSDHRGIKTRWSSF